MARILFGGPQKEGEHNPVHDDLVQRLALAGHRFYYMDNSESFLWEVGMIRMCNKVQEFYPKFAERLIDNVELRPYDLVIYDFDLLFKEVPLNERVEMFDQTTGIYLSVTQRPTIIIAPEEVKFELQPKLNNGKFTLITKPYKAEEVLQTINKLVQK
ncbi:hypothetical protein HZA97_07005 [Candidatus Woesearchaeota archaeon]|nr:hypothetical protein [Candidatus Woesearchaeota archaeon]